MSTPAVPSAVEDVPPVVSAPAPDEDEAGQDEDYSCVLTGLSPSVVLPLPPNAVGPDGGQDDLPMGWVEIRVRRRSGLVPRAKALLQDINFSLQQALAASLGNMEEQLAAMKPRERQALEITIRRHLEGTIRAQFAAERVSIGDLYEDEEETIYIGRLDGADEEEAALRETLSQIAGVLESGLLAKHVEKGEKKARKTARVSSR